MNTTAVIVTFNKLELLKECIEAIRKQTYKVTNIVVIDNNSTDGTEEYLKQQIDLINIRSSKNVGGAGGFELGIKHFMQDTTDDFCWIMDDDTIPDTTCLSELINAGDKLDNKYGFLSSLVYWKDNNPCLMNMPNLANNWYDKVGEQLIRIKQASFVSILTRREVVANVGLPIGEFFIWGDDSEYTERISTSYSSYFVMDSKAFHKMKENTAVNIIEDNQGRIPRYVYSFRNRFFIAKRRGVKMVIRELVRNMYLIFKILFKAKNYRLLRITQIIKGQFKGLFFNPVIKKVEE